MLKKIRCLPGRPGEIVEIDEASAEGQAILSRWAANTPPVYAVLVEQIKAEGEKRLKEIFPALDDLDEIKLVAAQWQSIAPASRQPTPEFQKAIDIYQAAKTAIQTAKAFTTQAEVDAYNVTIDPGWPA